jgi:hypothetical protein
MSGRYIKSTLEGEAGVTLLFGSECCSVFHIKLQPANEFTRINN